MAWAVENWGVNIANIIGIAVFYLEKILDLFSFTCG
jgi:hypothetical protein